MYTLDAQMLTSLEPNASGKQTIQGLKSAWTVCALSHVKSVGYQFGSFFLSQCVPYKNALLLYVSVYNVFIVLLYIYIYIVRSMSLVQCLFSPLVFPLTFCGNFLFMSNKTIIKNHFPLLHNSRLYNHPAHNIVL